MVAPRSARVLKIAEDSVVMQQQVATLRNAEAAGLHQSLEATLQQVDTAQRQHDNHANQLQLATSVGAANEQNMQKQKQLAEKEVQRFKEEKMAMATQLTEKEKVKEKLEKESQEQLQYLEGRLLSARQQQHKEAKQKNEQLLVAQEHRARLQDMILEKQQLLKAQEDNMQQYEEARNLNKYFSVYDEESGNVATSAASKTSSELAEAEDEISQDAVRI
eukprot:symbB.v1.2.027908.t1/scaffold2900.1/size67660/1